MSDGFVNLHVHTDRSLLDGMIKIDDLVSTTLEYGQIASVITDHGNMYSTVDHFKEAKKKGQHAIAGVELYMVNNMTVKGGTEGESENGSQRNHFLLLAKNKAGYQKMCRIVSKGYTEGYYYRPRVDNNVFEEFLDENENDLIASSACLAGKIPQHILHGEFAEAEKVAKYYQQLFSGNFWLEIQPMEGYEQYVVNKELIAMSKRLSIPLIATTDAHYLKKEDKKTHDILLCLQSGSLITDPNRWSFPGNSYYIMKKNEILDFFTKGFDYKLIKKENKKKKATEEFKYEYIHDYDGAKFVDPEHVIDGFVSIEDQGHFSYTDLDQTAIAEAVAETERVAEMCNFEIELGKHYLPKINIPVDNPEYKKWIDNKKKRNLPLGKDNENYLKFLCQTGLQKLGLKPTKEIRERLDYELNIINNMGFPDYFLIYYDIANFCHEKNIPFGPGRGCFVKDSMVTTENSTTAIQNIQLGDNVYCHDENLHPVLAKHEYDIDEDITDIQCGDKKIDGVTLDHKIFAIKQKDYENGSRQPQWYSAKELTVGDYIVELN